MLADAHSTRVFRLASGLAERGHYVRIVSYKVRDVPVVTVEKFSVPRFGWRYPVRWQHRWAMYLRRIMREHNVVHVQFLQDFGLTPETAAAGRLIVSPLGSDICKPPDLDAYPDEIVHMRHELLRTADAVSVCSRAFAAQVAEYAGLHVDNIELVPMGVDLELFCPQPRDPHRPPTVGFFKGFNPVYGPTVFVRAIPKVLSAVPQARFEMVGRGKLLGECQALAHSLGVAHAVVWVDQQPHDRLPDLICRWDISAVPSMCESFGVAALESSAMEVPVVASRVGGLPETVRDGQTGLLVPPGDSDALADAIVELLLDEPRRRAMGAAGRRMVAEEYEWGSCLDRWEALYRRVVEGACKV